MSRVFMYPLTLGIGIVFWSIGYLEFDFKIAALANLSGLASAGMFFQLYKRGFEEKTGIWLFPGWAAVDIIIISTALYSTHDALGPTFYMYLLSITAASFSEGGLTVFVVGIFDILAYGIVIWLHSNPDNLVENLQTGLFRIILLYSLLGFFFKGMSTLRLRRLEIKNLLKEKNEVLQDLDYSNHEKELALLDLYLQTRELEKAKDTAKLANETKSKFLANMSHELRTPLNSILGFSDILIRLLDDKIDKKQEKFLLNINQSGRHLLALINDILDLSKVEAGKMELHLDKVDLGSIVEGVASVMVGMASKRNISISPNIPKDLPTAVQDGPRIKQILYNLISNAVKFSPDGGDVVVNVDVVHESGSPLEIESARFFIQDFGLGIKPEDQAKVFGEFQQIDDGTNRSYAGTGLGLALVKKFCHLMGGTITCESEWGKGSTFTVWLPMDATNFALESK